MFVLDLDLMALKIKWCGKRLLPTGVVFIIPFGRGRGVALVARMVQFLGESIFEGLDMVCL